MSRYTSLYLELATADLTANSHSALLPYSEGAVHGLQVIGRVYDELLCILERELTPRWIENHNFVGLISMDLLPH
jgi:hypothetical protein